MTRKFRSVNLEITPDLIFKLDVDGAKLAFQISPDTALGMIQRLTDGIELAELKAATANSVSNSVPN